MERHPTSGPVWWVCARTLSAPDPEDEVWRCLERLDRDPTMDDLSFALADSAIVVVVGWSERLGPALARRGELSVRVLDVEGDGAGFARLLDRAGMNAVDVDVAALSGAITSADLVLLDAAVVGPDALLAAPGSHAAAALAHTAGVPVWAALRSLGRSGVADLVDGLHRNACAIADGIRTIEGAEVLNDVVYTQVSVSFGSDERTREVTARLLADGVAWMSGSRWMGRDVLRVSVSNWSTDDADVAASVDSVRRAATR